MPEFRFIHASDLHLGRRFGSMPEPVRGRLVEARHRGLGQLAEAARSHGAGHVLLAGDTFDSETPSDPVWRQALMQMAADPGLHWWLLPGNHDSLAAETLWDRLRAQAPGNVHLLDTDAPLELASGVNLLPAPLPHRRPGRDLTAWMPGCATPAGNMRLGLAHGAVQDFAGAGGAGGEDATAVIPPDRAQTAGLDYLALGDWHGQQAIGPRCAYSGTPERDSFRHAGRGACLAVTLPGPGAAPRLEPVETGVFSWETAELLLTPDADAVAALAAALPPPGPGRRDMLLRLRLSGRVRPQTRAALAARVETAAPEFWHLTLSDEALITEHRAEDLDTIAAAGALRAAAAVLMAEAADLSRAEADRRVAAAALDRLHGYLREGVE